MDTEWKYNKAKTRKNQNPKKYEKKIMVGNKNKYCIGI